MAILAEISTWTAAAKEETTVLHFQPTSHWICVEQTIDRCRLFTTCGSHLGIAIGRWPTSATWLTKLLEPDLSDSLDLKF